MAGTGHNEATWWNRRRASGRKLPKEGAPRLSSPARLIDLAPAMIVDPLPGGDQYCNVTLLVGSAVMLAWFSCLVRANANRSQVVLPSSLQAAPCSPGGSEYPARLCMSWPRPASWCGSAETSSTSKKASAVIASISGKPHPSVARSFPTRPTTINDHSVSATALVTALSTRLSHLGPPLVALPRRLRDSALVQRTCLGCPDVQPTHFLACHLSTVGDLG